METQKIKSDLQHQSSERVVKERDPMVAFQQRVLATGIGSIKDIGRKFRILDKDKNGKLDKEELVWIIQNRGVKCGQKDVKTMAEEVMAGFDKDSDGKISYDEFLLALRPTMSDKRKAMVKTVFAKMDKTGDGVIKVDDLISTYDVSKHTDFLNGKKNRRQLLVEFLESFELDDHSNPNEDDIEITLDEWIDYFRVVSASIDNDAYFDLMMRNAWKL